MPGRVQQAKHNVETEAGGADVAGPAVRPAHYVGHRDRLRARFRDAGPDALQDYELLELLLFQAIPQKDVKPLAKALLAEFGSLWGVLNASADALKRHKMVKDAAVAALKVNAAIALRMARQDILGKPVLGSWTKVMDYCTAAMAHEPTEQFRILFLDRKNTLIADEVQQRGTVHDHIIIGKGRHVSFKGTGLL